MVRSALNESVYAVRVKLYTTCIFCTGLLWSCASPFGFAPYSPTLSHCCTGFVVFGLEVFCVESSEGVWVVDFVSFVMFSSVFFTLCTVRPRTAAITRKMGTMYACDGLGNTLRAWLAVPRRGCSLQSLRTCVEAVNNFIRDLQLSPMSFWFCADSSAGGTCDQLLVVFVCTPLCCG